MFLFKALWAVWSGFFLGLFVVFAIALIPLLILVLVSAVR